ncbi:MAG: UDP-glucose/GDP-mannose dehydrogenase family protein [Candidatus Woesearchaeota archaeon]
MRISVFGSGYVGLVTGVCLADLGNEVICADVDEDKVRRLNSGDPVIYEPGLRDLLARNLREGRITFTTDTKKAVEPEIIYIAVGTPEGEDGRADLKSVFSVAETIRDNMDGYRLIVTKSTVPMGTNDKIEEIINDRFSDFDVVSNPEFLREGRAIYDFKNPDRIIVGTDSEKAKALMNKLYAPVIRTENPIVFMKRNSAELAKYASNAMLATRISFVNMLSRLCENNGGDITEVSKGMGLDKRIGSRFLHAGIGYGGSCFPKDVKALQHTLKDHGCDSSILDAVENVNHDQKDILPKIRKILPELSGKRIGLLGLAFKPKTDDIREAPALTIIQKLIQEGAKVQAFDPEAAENVAKQYKIEIKDTPYDTAKDADCLVVCTEWDEFRSLDLERIKGLMNQPNIVDGRNIYNPEHMQGFNYIGIGR